MRRILVPTFAVGFAIMSLTACGPSAKPSGTSSPSTTPNGDTSGSDTGAITDTNVGGSYDGYAVHEFTTPDARCVFVDESYDNNVGLSCWPDDTSTPPSTAFTP